MERQLYFFKENFAIISDNYLTDKYLRRQLPVKIHTQKILNIYFVRYVFLTFFSTWLRFSVSAMLGTGRYVMDKICEDSA